MNTELNCLFDRVGQEALVELFSAYNVETAIEPTEQLGESQLIGVIGFTAPKLRGNLALILSARLVEATYSGSDIMDWAGELTNQYLGRIKNKLIAYGVALEVATPAVVSGLSITLQEPRGTETHRVDCNTEAGPVHALVNVRTTEDYELPPPSEVGPAASEGEMLLF